MSATAKSIVFAPGTPLYDIQTDFAGPVAKDYLATDTPGMDFDTGTCAAGNTVPLSVLNQVRVDGPATASAQIIQDSFDGHFTTQPAGPGASFTIVAQRCGPADDAIRHFEGVTLGGSGCPGGSFSQLSSAQEPHVGLAFVSFVASSGPGGPVTEARKNRQLNYNVHLPEDWTWGRLDIDQRGYVRLPAGNTAGSTASTASDFILGGVSEERGSDGTFAGPCSADDLFRHGSPTFDVTAFAGTVVPVNVNAQVRVNTPSSVMALATMDSLDGRAVGGPGPAPDPVPSSISSPCAPLVQTITASATTADGNTYTAGTLTNQAVTVTFTCATEGSPVASCTAPITFSADGSHTAEGTVTTESGLSASTSFGPILIDRTPPVCSGTATPNVLWPPNNQLAPVSVTVSASEGTAATLASLTSTEGNPSGDQQGFVAGTTRPSSAARRPWPAPCGPSGLPTAPDASTP